MSPTITRPKSDIARTERPFKVVSDFEPSGDQPAAIAELTKRIEAGEQDLVLLGATGTGKSATAAWLIEAAAAAHAGAGAEQDPGSAAGQ